VIQKSFVRIVTSFVICLFFATLSFAGIDLVVNNSDRVDPVPAGAVINYDIRVTNSSETGTTATNVDLTVTIPATTSLISSTGDGIICDPVAGSTLICHFGTLSTTSPADEKTVVVSLQSTVQGFITLNAVAAATEADDNGANNSAPQSTTINNGADLSLSMNGSASADAGERVSYNLVVTNNGPDSAGNQQLSYPIPSGFVLDNGSLPSGCSESGSILTCTLSGPLANSASTTIGPINGQISAAGTSTVSHTASIAVAPTAPGSDSQDPDTTDNTANFNTTVNAGSDLALNKTRSTSGSLLVGSNFNYILTPTFTGNSPSGITVSDTLPNNFTIGTLAATQNGWSCSNSGQTVTCTKANGSAAGYNQSLGTITIPVTVAASGNSITNSATITATSPNDPDNSNNTDSDSVNLIDPTVDLNMTKSGPSPALVVVGVPFNYNLSPSNVGTTGFYGDLVITENIPTGLTVTGITLNGWSCDQSPIIAGPATLLCQRTYSSGSPLAAGANTPALSLTVEATTTGLLSNTATIATPNCNLGAGQCNDGDLARYNVTASINAASADISLTKTVTDPVQVPVPVSVPAGDILTYSLEVINNDSATTSTHVVLSDRLSNLINNLVGSDKGFVGYTINSGVVDPADISCSTAATASNERTLTCSIDSLPVCTAGSNCPTVTVQVRPGGNGGVRSNTATVISNGTADPVHSNDSSSVSITVDPRADIYPVKTVTPDPVPAGQNLTYIVSVGNYGPSRAENATLTDTLPDDLTFVSATPSSGSCSTIPPAGKVTDSDGSGNEPDQIICNLGTINNNAQQTLTVVVRPNRATIGNNSLTNQVTVATSTIETDSGNNSTSRISSVSNPSFDLVINKSDTVGGTNYDPVAVGDDMQYRIVVSNSGPSAVEGVSVTDSLPATHLSYQAVNGATCSTEPAVDSFGGTLTCGLGYLASGEAKEFTVTMKATAKGLISNNAAVTSDLDAYEAVNGNNNVSEQTTVRTKADMAVFSKIAYESGTNTPRPTVNLRDNFDFVIRIENDGGAVDSGLAEADEVEVSDTLPSGMELTGNPTVTLISGDMPTLNSCSGAAEDTAFTCSLGTVTRDTIVDIRLPVQLVSVTSMPQTFENTASVTTNSLDVDTSNDSNSGSVTTNSSSLSGQVFRDFNNDGSVTADDTGISDVTITLSGTSFDDAAVSQTVTSDSDGNFTFTGLPQSNGSGYIIIEGAISEAHLIDGTDTSGGAGGDAITINDRVTGIVLAADETTSGYLFAEVPVARIGLAKQVTSGPTVQADGTFITTFTLEVENFSLEQLNNITVTDDLTAGIAPFGALGTDPLANGQYLIETGPSEGCGGANGSYDGSGDTTVASGFNLIAGAICNIDFSIRLRPTAPLPVVQASGGRYENKASITATGDLSDQPLSDDSVDGNNPDPGGNDLAEESGPTPVSPSYGASIGLAKDLTTLNILADGTIEATFLLTVSNNGNEPLNNVVIKDPLAGAAPSFGTFAATPVTAGQYNFVVNSITPYGGVSGVIDNSIQDVDIEIATMPIGSGCTISHTVTFGPSVSTVYTNQADTTANADYTETEVSDLSDDGLNPDSNGNGISNEAGENDPTPVPYPRIGVAKELVDNSTTTNADGSVSVPFSFVVENLGGETLNNIILSDDLSGVSPQFGSYVASDPIAANEYTIETVPAFSGPCSGSPNATFNGDDTPAVATVTSLAVGTTCTVTTTVKFRPGAPLPPGGNYTNQATVSAIGAESALDVSDSSDDGTNPDIDNDGIADEAEENDPTPVNVSFTPQIAVNKHLNGAETINADGTITVPFRVKVTNSGTEPLLTLSVNDHLAGAAPSFGTFVTGGASASLSNGQYTVQTAPFFNGSCTTGTLSASYTGDGQDQLATLTRLEVLDACEIDLSLRFRPTSPLPVGGYSNQATAQGTGEFSEGDPVSDQSHNGIDPDPDGNNDPTNNSNPTPVTFNYTPSIGVAKELSESSILDSNGSYRGTFRISVKNLGDEELVNVSINDAMNSAPSNLGNFVAGGSSASLSAGQYTIESAPIFVGPCTNGSLNGGFNGASTNQLASISELAIDASCTVDYVFRFVPSPSVNYLNQASASAEGTFSTTDVNDLSDNGTTIDGNDNKDATEAEENDPTPIAYPRIGLAKQLVGGSTTHDDGTISVPFSFVATNLGGETLNAVTIGDDLSGAAPQFGTYVSGGAAATLAANQYTIQVAPALNSCSGGALSLGFDGNSNQALATIANLSSGATCSLTTTIRFRPGLPFPAGGNYTNQASVQARGSVSGIDIDDLSDNGTLPDSDGDGVGNEPIDNDPTPVPVSTTPQIAVNKHLTTAETINVDGTVTVPFRIKVTNSGTEPLISVTVDDHLTGTAPRFGSFVAGGASASLSNGQYTIQTAPAFNGSCTTGTLTAAYAGDTQDQLASITRLEVFDSCEIDFSLRFRPTSPLPASGYSNQATAEGTGEFSSGAPVTDQSHNGLDPDPNSNDDPTDNNDPTPVNPTHTAGIGIAKNLNSGLFVNVNGSYSGTFRLVVENLGNEDLLSVNINDAMNSAPSNLGTYVAGGSAATLSAGQYSIESPPALIGSCPNALPNAAFNGQATPIMATISELMTGSSCTFEYSFRFVPTPGMSYLNQATTNATGSFSGGAVSDQSDDGSDVDPNGNMDADEAGENDPTPIPIPRIGVSKSAGAVINNGDGTYNVPFVLKVTNAGETSLSTVQIDDSLSDFGTFTTATVPAAGQYSISTDPTIASATNGAVFTAVDPADFTGAGAGASLLIAASSSLPNHGSGNSSTAEIHFTLRFFPTIEGPFNNSAVATASSPTGGNVTDASVSGNTPDADGNGDPGDDSGPTVVNLSGQIIGVAKQLESVIQLTTKSYDILYSLIVENPSSSVTATNVQVSDNLNTTFPTAETISINSPANVSGCSGTVLNPATPAFNGTTQSNLLAGNQNLQPGERCAISFTARINFGSSPLPSVIQNNSATATTGETSGGTVIASDLSDNGNDPDPNGNENPSEIGENDPTPVDFRSENLATVSGTLWLDGNHDRIDNDETTSNLPTFFVEILNNAGDIVGSTTTDENGDYSVANLFPSTPGTPATYYSVRFREQASNVIYGNPLSHDSSNPNGTIANGIITELQLVSATNTVNQDLPLDPSGVIYDAVTRQPTAGATITLNGPVGFDPALHLVGGDNNVTQITGANGFYQYILLAGAPNGQYSLEVIPPVGYLPTASVMIPACTNTPTIGAVPDPALVQSSPNPPLAAAPLQDPAVCPATSAGFTMEGNSTRYYNSFDLTIGTSADVVNNHIPVDPVLGGAITLVKTSPLVNVSIGQLVPYTITATNTLSAPLSNIDLHDSLPPGFKYKSGSASLDGSAVSPALNGRTLSLDNLSFPANGRRSLQMLLVVGAGVQPGEYINRARMYNNLVPAPDNTVSNEATATVRVVPDPVFDCSDVIGKVFDDKNANGYQDDGEKPLPNVRLATVRGLLVTTDVEGRYHVTCAMVPNEIHGSNFIMKLDERTLPSGYRLTTENPRTVLLTRGKMGKLNFGAAIHRILRLEMTNDAFQPDSNQVTDEMSKALEQLPKQLREAPSVIRLAYNKNIEDEHLIRKRLKQVRRQLEQLWSDQGNCYDLSFEEEIFQRSINNAGGAK
jgi:uncharacterized repeat protein (TIGR01451 family)